MPGMQKRRPLGQILKDLNLVTEGQIQQAIKVQDEEGGALGSIMVTLNFVTDDEVRLALGTQFGMEVISLAEMDIAPEVIDMVSVNMATVYRIVPLSFENNILTVAMADPMDMRSLDDLRFLLNCDIKGAISNEDDINRALEKYYAGQTDSVEDLIAEFDDVHTTEILTDSSETIDLDSIEEMAESAPVRKLLNLVLLQAIKDRASDIHFEPFEDEFKIRYRIDGVLYEMVPPPRHLSIAITSRIKVMSNLNIAERRMPQDGRIELNIGGNPVDLRVAVLPTMFGESVVMRVLNRSQVSLELDKLGMRSDDLSRFRELIFRPHGIILVTGPTGSGKTTTLYSALTEANDIETKIITTEDPVEYDLDGIIQVQINTAIGVTFAGCLRSILRQDPDKILVGEIRDIETAQIAIQASLTGHIVFSTLHTNDAPSSITRLIDMGVDPYLITATLQAIMAQRLVRTICSECKEEYQPTEEMLAQVELRPEDVKGKTFHYGRGCDLCNNTGYRGRRGLYELMIINDEIKELIMEQASTGMIRTAGLKSGMRGLRESGLLAIYDGVTTVEEVARSTLLE